MRIRGLTGTALFLARTGLKRLGANSSETRKAAAALRATEALFDAKHGVDTAGFTPVTELDVADKSWIYGTAYQGVSCETEFASLLGPLNLDYSKSSFVDLGSGKGRAVMLASVLPFRQVIGVEFSQKLHDIAQSNIRRWPHQAKVSLVRADASAYSLPDGPLVLFLYNPFGPPIMEKVVANALQSKRRLVVIYFTPHHASLWDAVPSLRRIDSRPGCIIWDSN